MTSRPPPPEGDTPGSISSRPPNLTPNQKPSRNPLSRRPMSAEPIPGSAPRPSSIRTPTTSLARLNVLSSSAPRTASRSARGKPQPPTLHTPHGRHAIRLLSQRRAAAALTPGPNRVGRRRKSVRDTRETPRDVLRNLSRVLAVKSEVIKNSSPMSPVAEDGKAGPDDGDMDMSIDRVSGYNSDDSPLPISRPRLSLPIDRSSSPSDIFIPQSSGLGLESPDAATQHSIELGRRAVSETPFHMHRPSLGGYTLSGDVNPFSFDPFNRTGVIDMGTPDVNVGVDSGFFPPQGIDPEFPAAAESSPAVRSGGDGMTTEYTGIELEPTTAGRESDSGLLGPETVGVDPNDTTVMISAQARDSPSRPPDVEQDSDGPENEPLDFDDNDEAPDVEFDSDSDAVEAEQSNLPSASATAAAKTSSKKKQVKLSKHGLQYPSLPPAVIKRLATTLAQQSGAGKVKLSPETLAEISKASDWFFQQLGDDLGAYAAHAGRKTIDESDMVALMRRQRQTNSSTTLFSLAQRHLPRELLQELRIPAPPAPKQRQQRRSTARRASS